MRKKLNPGLFKEVTNPEKVQVDPQLEQQAGSFGMPSQSNPGIENHRLFEELQSVKAKMRAMDNQNEVLRSQMSEFIHSMDQRFERLSQALSRLEKSMHQQERSMDDKVRQVREKIQAQSFEEAKVEGLIERQMLLIRNFENRVSSLQKLVNEKELLIMKFHEALKQR